MNEKQKEVLKQAKEIQEIILSDFKKINTAFEDNNISWYPHGGTLLGSHRTGGFIPWDDDIDMWMSLHEVKNNFSKIINILNLHDYQIFFGYGDWEWWRMPYIKLFKRTTSIVNKQSYRPYIDVMLTQPYDSMSNAGFIDLHKIERKYANNLVNPFLPKSTANKYKRKVFDMLDYSMSDKYRFIDWKANIDFFWDVTKTQKIKFEGIQLNTPKNYVDWLAIFYKDTHEIVPEVPEKLQHNDYVKSYLKINTNQKRTTFEELLKSKN